MNARQRAASRKAKQNAGQMRVSVRTTAPGLLLACRQAGENAVKFSAALAGTQSLKEIMPYVTQANAWDHAVRVEIRRNTTDSRNPRDIDAENAEQHARNLADLLSRGIIR